MKEQQETAHSGGKFSISRRTFLGGSALLGAGASLLGMSGCLRKEGDAAETINYYIGNPVSIDPYNAQENNGNMVARQLFDPLVQMNFNTNELEGVAADSWYSNEDGTIFTFHIKEGNTFHNGEVVDAWSFKRGWDRLCNPATGGSPSVVSYYLKNVKGYAEMSSGLSDELSGVTCPDDYTLQVELVTPFVEFPMIATIMCTAPVPKAALEDFQAFYQAPIGNGPYKMDGKWEDGQYIYLERYDEYKNGPLAKTKNLHFNIQKDVETAFREFEAGNIDIVDIPTNQSKDMIEKYGTAKDGYTIEPNHQVLQGDQPSTYYLTLNVANPVLKDVNIRRAISLAINRENICKIIMEDSRIPADNIVPPHCAGYVEGQWQYARYDRDAARDILDTYYPKDANGDRGISLELTYNIDGSHKAVMEAVSADLEEVGIKTVQVTKEWAAVLSAYNVKDYVMGRGAWLAEYPSIDDFLYPLLFSGNDDNTSGFSDARFDELITKARGCTDEAKRLDFFYEANKIAGDQVPYVPIMFYRVSKIGSSRIKQAYITPIVTCSGASWELE